jgi:thiamine-monophosphate kinase
MPFFIFIMSEKKFQEIKELGFSALIEKFKSYTGANKNSVVKGIGDDCSVSVQREGFLTCSTCEIFLEGVHFDLTYTPFHHLGYKIVTAAVSDLYAMNALPEQLLVSIAIPNRYSVQMTEQLYKGIDAACKDYDLQLTGGDTTASHQILAISVTALGSVSNDDIIYRKGAQKGDIICVTGDLGGALAGLRILLREKQSWQEGDQDHFQPELEKYEKVVQRQLVPGARKDFIDAIHDSGIKPHAMIDLTQGLIADLRELAKNSDLGAELYSPAIPISLETRAVADEMSEDVDKYAFYGGEDFEILFTIPEPIVEKMKAEFDDFVVIGRMTDENKMLTINTGEEKSYQIEI